MELPKKLKISELNDCSLISNLVIRLYDETPIAVVRESQPDIAATLVRRYNAHDDLLTACTRMMVGITKESTPNCIWYEGIEHDGADEAKQAIAAAQDGSG